MVVAPPIILKEQQFQIIKNENKNLCKIFNLSEIESLFENYPSYRIFLYTIESLDYIEIKSTEFLKKLEIHCTKNLNYSMINYVDHTEQVLKIYITPIVTSA